MTHTDDVDSPFIWGAVLAAAVLRLGPIDDAAHPAWSWMIARYEICETDVVVEWAEPWT